MFYSHQLLARKASLGQIWMAATMHAKINRRKLDKLDIIKICEEILNPSVPMALRLSGILMGGVVIVYERKVKLLYDDVTRFMVEINDAWKAKPVADPTLLPKGKTQAKFEAVTLPDNVEMETEQSLTATRIQRMRFDDLDEHYINIDMREEDLTDQNHHQADAANITLTDHYGSFVETDNYNQFERFDVGDDEETHINLTPQEHPKAPFAPLSQILEEEQPQARFKDTPWPHPPHESPKATFHAITDGEIRNQSTGEQKAPDGRRKQLANRRSRNHGQVKMDDEQIMIAGDVYQSWLKDPSNIVKKRGRIVKPKNPILSMKISNLMDLPPVALLSSVQSFPGDVQYPAPLMELWRKYSNSNPAQSSSSGGTLLPQALEAATSQSPLPELSTRNIHHSPPEAPRNQMDWQMDDISIEKLRGNLEDLDFQGIEDSFFTHSLFTPANSGQSSRSIPSSGSDHLQMEPEMQLPTVRSKKRQHSSSRNGLGNLETVEEEFPLQQSVRDFKMRKITETGPTPDFELMEETERPTLTPHDVIPDPFTERITQSIRTHLKLHFDTPGAPQVESLDQLASGMNRKKAAQLFYQTCVLATCGFIKVKQIEPYGDISISRGPKM